MLNQLLIFDSNTLEILLLDKRELKDRTIYYRGDAVLRKYLGLHYRVYIGIEESFTADLIEPVSFSEELTLVVDTLEYYHHDIYKLTLYIPVVETITFDLVSHDISEQITLNAEVEDGIPTATPTIGTLYCNNTGGNKLEGQFTNNDSETVTIYRGGVAIGTLNGNETKTLVVVSPITTPLNYNYNFTAQASGKLISDTVNKTGTITFCVSLW